MTVAIVHEAQVLVEEGIIKAGDIRGPIRAGRVYGWYFLPSSEEHLAKHFADTFSRIGLPQPYETD